MPSLFAVALSLVLFSSLGNFSNALEIKAQGRLSHKQGGQTKYRIPVALNDDHDCGLNYAPMSAWGCEDKCPDGNCDHREHEPVWDYAYVGGRVEQETDLLELEIDGENAVLESLSGNENIRVWPYPRKGGKSDIISLPEETSRLPGKIYVEGIKCGTTVLKLSSPDSGDAFELAVDVVQLVESQNGKRHCIYRPGNITLKLEPTKTLNSAPYYRGVVVWKGDADGRMGSHVIVKCDTGEDPALRRAMYNFRVEIKGGLTLERKVRVRQNIFTGTPPARTTAERRREVESLVELPAAGYRDTEWPNKASVRYSQRWFEERYTGSSTPGDPVKPVNEARLQYAPEYDLEKNGYRGVMCCGGRPYGAFITALPYESGMKLEDIRGIAGHEARHLAQSIEIDNGLFGPWFDLCGSIPEEIASYFKEADATSVGFANDNSWRYLRDSERSLIKNYREAEKELYRLPTLSQRKAGSEILQSVYAGLPEGMVEFKRKEYECYIRPPTELEKAEYEF